MYQKLDDISVVYIWSLLCWWWLVQIERASQQASTIFWVKSMLWIVPSSVKQGVQGTAYRKSTRRTHLRACIVDPNNDCLEEEPGMEPWHDHNGEIGSLWFVGGRYPWAPFDEGDGSTHPETPPKNQSMLLDSRWFTQEALQSCSL